MKHYNKTLQNKDDYRAIFQAENKNNFLMITMIMM